jgi:hypothetical protein
MPRGKGFIDFPEFEQGYEALKLTTEGFQDMNPDKVMETLKEVPLSLIVLRSILGFTPPEWAYIASQQLGDNDSRGTVCPILPCRHHPQKKSQSTAISDWSVTIQCTGISPE